MNKCVKVIARSREPELIYVRDIAERAAREHRIEGTLYVRIPDHVEIIAAGSKHDVDLFIDFLYRDLHEVRGMIVEIEPAFKDRDYRGVFRIIH